MTKFMSGKMVSEAEITDDHYKQTYPSNQSIPWTAKAEGLPQELKFVPRMKELEKAKAEDEKSFLPENPMMWMHLELTGTDLAKD